jgi:glycosyltransferase involved in cell wall biosynthesis
MIVTDVGGLRESIGDRGTGLVVSEGTPEAIRKEIEKYFQDTSIAETCIKNIQSEKERLSWKGFAERLIEYIEKL